MKKAEDFNSRWNKELSLNKNDCRNHSAQLAKLLLADPAWEIDSVQQQWQMQPDVVATVQQAISLRGCLTILLNQFSMSLYFSVEAGKVLHPFVDKGHTPPCLNLSSCTDVPNGWLWTHQEVGKLHLWCWGGRKIMAQHQYTIAC